MPETYQPPTNLLRRTSARPHLPTSFPHPPTSFPHPPRHSREGGNPPRCVQLPKDSTPPAVYKIRQKSTESNRIQQKFVCARTHARGIPRHSREGGNLPARVPHPFSRHGLFPDRSGSTYRLELQSHKPHANKSNGTAQSQWLTHAKAQSAASHFPRKYGDCTPPTPGRGREGGLPTCDIPTERYIEICDSTS